MSRAFLACAVPALVELGACRPDFDDDYWRVESLRVLAVKSEPAESRPGTQVAFTALLSVAGTGGEVPAWSFCTSAKPLTENNSVAAACLASVALVPAGRGSSIEAETPSAGCSLFGPIGAPGGFRPRDPDISGGYYQPLRLDLSGVEPTFHLQRIFCDLADAASDTAAQFATSYAMNRNPRLNPLEASIAGQPIALAVIPSGARVDFAVSWSATDAESYLYYERSRQVLTSKREAMRVSWYASGGTLETEATASAENDPESTAANHWTAPDRPGTISLWVVLRDSRGGVDFGTYELTVQP